MIKVESIPSALPNWFDPAAPDFKKPDSWVGTRVKISIPVSLDPAKELQEARVRLEKRYPGATLHLVPEFTKIDSPEHEINTEGSDEDLLLHYFSTLTLPEHTTPEQVVAYLLKFLPAIGSFGVKGVKFLSIKGSNVLSFEKFEWNLDEKGLTLVTGKNDDWNGRSNGAGKSSWTSLPFIGLFGKTFKGQTHDEWAYQNTDKPAIIEEILQLPDGRILKIIRQRRPSLLRLYLDDKEITMGTPNATQNLIEHLTNLTWEVLTNALYIGQSEIGSVFGTEKERKELFSRLLGLDRFLTVQATLRKIALRIQRSADSIENEIDSVDSALNEVKESLQGLRFNLKQLPEVDINEVKNLSADVERFKSCIKTEELVIVDLKKARDVLENEFHQWGKLVSSAEAVIGVTEKQLKDTQKAKLRCHVCGNSVKVDVLAKYQKELNVIIAAEKEKVRLGELDEDHLKKLITENKNSQRSAEQVICKLRNDERNAFYSLERVKQNKDARIEMKKNIASRKRRIDELSRNKQIHEQAKIFTLEEKQFLDICINAVSRDGLPAYICSVVAPQLNKTTAHYSEVFSEGEIGIQFQISNGDIDVNVCNLHGGKNIKDQSAGEMRMAGIITAFTFRDVLVPLNLLVCDEPSDGFDGPNALAFAKGLNQIIDRFQHIVVISHNSNLLGALEPTRHIEITKTNGVSVSSIV